MNIFIMRETQAEQEYVNTLKKLLEKATNAGITAEEFYQIVNNSLNNQTIKRRNLFQYKKSVLFVVFLLLCAISFTVYDKPLNIFLCKIQEFIYPGLKVLRIISVPIISFFPSLTELYDETCLIQNPFFQVTGMDCWPCSGVNKIVEKTHINEHFQPQTSPPFIYKTKQKIIKIEDLKTKYLENKKIFDDNASKITINQKDKIFTHEFFDNLDISDSNTYKWRINRMLPALTMRTIFPRPSIVPRLGHSTERFIIIDNPNSMSYQLPEPECNYVFIVQSSGEKLIEFQPAKECIHKCESVSILLKESYMLWYNWWYWKPISHSTTFNSTSISYMGSYC